MSREAARRTRRPAHAHRPDPGGTARNQDRDKPLAVTRGNYDVDLGMGVQQPQQLRPGEPRRPDDPCSQHHPPTLCENMHDYAIRCGHDAPPGTLGAHLTPPRSRPITRWLTRTLSRRRSPSPSMPPSGQAIPSSSSTGRHGSGETSGPDHTPTRPQKWLRAPHMTSLQAWQARPQRSGAAIPASTARDAMTLCAASSRSSSTTSSAAMRNAVA